MHGQMPQEIEVWYIIPALRRELAKSMVADIRLTQKDIAKVMGITEAAVSQYIHSKRAKEVIFGKEILKEVKKSAKAIAENKDMLIPEMMKLTRLTEVKHVMCDLHKKHDISIPKGCETCFDEELIQLK